MAVVRSDECQWSALFPRIEPSLSNLILVFAAVFEYRMATIAPCGLTPGIYPGTTCISKLFLDDASGLSWYSGVVVAARMSGNGTLYSVEYDDGDVFEMSELEVRKAAIYYKVRRRGAKKRGKALPRT